MTITIHSTSKIVELITPDTRCPIKCRVWEGQTITGVQVHCFIPRIAAKDDQDLSQFEAELVEQRPATPEIQAIPFRLIL